MRAVGPYGSGHEQRGVEIIEMKLVRSTDVQTDFHPVFVWLTSSKTLIEGIIYAFEMGFLVIPNDLCVLRGCGRTASVSLSSPR